MSEEFPKGEIRSRVNDPAAVIVLHGHLRYPTNRDSKRENMDSSDRNCYTSKIELADFRVGAGATRYPALGFVIDPPAKRVCGSWDGKSQQMRQTVSPLTTTGLMP